jgi:hypothetical protein
MKTPAFVSLLIFLSLSGCYPASMSSSSDLSIPRDANTILISNARTRDDLYREVSSMLFQNGIGITYSDRDLGQITAGPGSFKNGNFILTIMLSDGSVLIRGKWSWNLTVTMSGVSTSPSDYDDIEYGGMSDSPKLNAWNAMQKIALQIPGKVEYLIK